MKQLIGFATQFYTLWTYEQTPVYSGNVVMNGVGPMQIGVNHQYYYHKNISTDLEKVKVLYPGVEIDEELRGVSGRSFERFEKSEYPGDCFSFGALAGVQISTVEHSKSHVWQLFRAMREEKGGRRRAMARRRLVELGELVRYKWIERVIRFRQKHVVDYERGPAGYFIEEDYVVEIKHKYATPKHVEIEEAKKKQAAQPFYFVDGEKVTLKVKEVAKFGFETQYGYTSVRVYETEDGKTVKYVGSSPIVLSEGFNEIKATVKHKEFRGNKETHLLRIKCL